MSRDMKGDTGHHPSMTISHSQTEDYTISALLPFVCVNCTRLLRLLDCIAFYCDLGWNKLKYQSSTEPVIIINAIF